MFTLLFSACASRREQKIGDYNKAKRINTKESWNEYYDKWGKFEGGPTQSNTDNESIYYNEFKLKDF